MSNSPRYHLGGPAIHNRLVEMMGEAGPKSIKQTYRWIRTGRFRVGKLGGQIFATDEGLLRDLERAAQAHPAPETKESNALRERRASSTAA